MSLPKKILEKKLLRFVEEDIGHGDVTAFYTIPRGTLVQAEVFAKEKGVVAGIEEASAFLETFGLQHRVLVHDGSKITEKKKILHIEGDAATLLSIERTLLNLLSRMSGIATATNRLVEKVHRAGYTTCVACTRKTGPGLAYFDKKAVIIGGGDPHRSGLDDMVLIKDNHIAVAGTVKEAIKRVHQAVSFSRKIEVEVSSADEALKAAREGIDILMLDNFTPRQAEDAIKQLKDKGLRDKIAVEASGGITEQNVLDYAAAGVDIVSLGEITQSVRALDVSLKIVKVVKNRS